MTDVAEYPQCGSLDCLPCSKIVRERLTPLGGMWEWPGTPPTQERFERHVRMYGEDGAAEVAAAFGLRFNGTHRKKRRSFEQTRAEVARLDEAGYSDHSISAALDITVKSVRNARAKTSNT